MMPPDVEPADLRQGRRAVRRRHRGGRGSNLARQPPPTRRSLSSSTIEALQAIVTPAQGLQPDAAILFPAHGSNVCFGTEHGADVDPFEGADEIAEVTMVSQRLAGAPMETNGILAEPGDGRDTSPAGSRTRHRTRRTAAIAAMLGMEPDRPPRGLPVGRWRLRPEGRRLSRVPDRGQGRVPRSGRASEVGRDPLGRHGVAGPRPRLRDDREARRHQRRQVHRPRR